jgi:hypothetical protein
MTPDTTIAVRKPADLVDATPYVIGFHPTESLVVLGISGNRVFFGARYDLPPPDGDDIVQLGAVIAAQQARCVAVLAYGPPTTVEPVIRRALEVLDAFRVRVLEAIRVHDGRWWSYFCSDPGCCPAEGTPFDTAASLIAAEATYRGQVALPSRQALVTLIAPVDGEARASMAAATARARSTLDRLLTDDQHGSRAVRRAGRLAVREAEKRYRSGRALLDDEIAWLGVLLLNPDVHEYTLGRLGDEEWRLALWTDVLRRVEPAYVPAAGCVLSYLAWRAGQGALARVAVDRALQADPQHPMAGLLDEVLGLGIGPHAMAALDSPSRLADFRRDQAPASRTKGRSAGRGAGSPASGSPARGATVSPASGTSHSSASADTGSPAPGATVSPASGMSGSPASGMSGSPASADTGSSVPGKTGSSASGAPRSGVRQSGAPASGTPGSPVSGSGVSGSGVPGSGVPGSVGSGLGSADSGTDSLVSGIAGSPDRRSVDLPLADMSQPPSNGEVGASARELDRPPRHKRRLRRVLRRRTR